MRKERYQAIQATLWVVLGFNWGVAIAKVIYGWVSLSASVLADGLHSFSDGSSNIVGLVAIGAAAKPRDKEHPYGHAKIETLVSLFIAALLILLSFEIIRSAFQRIFHPVSPNITGAGFVILLLTMLINTIIYLYESHQAKKWNSDFLLADSYHTRSDIFVSVLVLATLAAIRIGYPEADLFTALLVAVTIARAGVDVLLRASRVLVDTRIIHPEGIEQIALQVAGVKRCYNIRSRGRQDEIFIDLHASVARTMNIEEAHRVSQEIEDRLKNSFPGVAEVIVHIEPE